MNGFLANLAGLALGQPPAGTARLSLPPRFSGGGQTDIDSGLEQVETTPSGPANPPLSVEPPRHAERRREMPATAVVVGVPVSASPSREQPAPRTTSPTTRQNDRPTSVEHAASARPSSSPPHAIEQAVVRSATETAAQALPFPPARPETIVKHVRDDRTPPHAAPLSQAALANRATVEREPPPVVNVIIDHIEVRAPRETPQLQTPRRAKPQPSVSLGDYLGARR